MSKLTESQKKIFIGVAALDGIIGLVFLALWVTDVIFIPILLPVGMLMLAAGLFIAARA